MLKQWFDEQCEVSIGARTRTSLLLKNYNGWLRGRGKRTMHARDFHSDWRSRFPSHRPLKANGQRCIADVILKYDFGDMPD